MDTAERLAPIKRSHESCVKGKGLQVTSFRKLSLRHFVSFCLQQKAEYSSRWQFTGSFSVYDTRRSICSTSIFLSILSSAFLLSTLFHSVESLQSCYIYRKRMTPDNKHRLLQRSHFLFSVQVRSKFQQHLKQLFSYTPQQPLFWLCY